MSIVRTIAFAVVGLVTIPAAARSIPSPSVKEEQISPPAHMERLARSFLENASDWKWRSLECIRRYIPVGGLEERLLVICGSFAIKERQAFLKLAGTESTLKHITLDVEIRKSEETGNLYMGDRLTVMELQKTFISHFARCSTSEGTGKLVGQVVMEPFEIGSGEKGFKWLSGRCEATTGNRYLGMRVRTLPDGPEHFLTDRISLGYLPADEGDAK